MTQVHEAHLQQEGLKFSLMAKIYGIVWLLFRKILTKKQVLTNHCDLSLSLIKKLLISLL
jgi:hypothetical protein